MEVTRAFKFCPRCGGPVQAAGDTLVCQQCGFTNYLDPKATITVALVNATGEFLLVKRAVEPSKGKWDLPGGFVEPRETFEDGAKREVREELGVEIENLRYLMSEHDTYQYQEVVSPTLAAVFTARIVGDTKPQAADDVASCTWVVPADFPYHDLAFPSLEPVLRRLEKL